MRKRGLSRKTLRSFTLLLILILVSSFVTPAFAAKLAATEGTDAFWRYIGKNTEWVVEDQYGNSISVNVDSEFPSTLIRKDTLTFTTTTAGIYSISFNLKEKVIDKLETTNRVKLKTDKYEFSFDWGDMPENYRENPSITYLVGMEFTTTALLEAGTEYVIDPSIIGESVDDASRTGVQRATFAAKGLHWVFYANQTGGLPADKKIWLATSSDGSTWDRNELPLGYLVNGEAYEFSVHYDQIYDKVVIVRVSDEEYIAPNLFFRQGTPEIDGSITWDAGWGRLYPADDNTYDARPSITIDSTAHAWISTYKRVGDSFYWAVYYIDRTDGTFTYPRSETRLSTGHWPDDGWSTSVIPMLDGSVYSVRGDADAVLVGREWNTTVWLSQETISASAIHQSVAFCAVAIDDDVHVTWKENLVAGYDIQHRKRVGATSTWDAETNVDTGDAGSFPVISKTDSLVSTDGQVHVIWEKLNDIYYRVRNAEGTWEDTELWLEAGVDWYDFTIGNTVTVSYQNYLIGEWYGVLGLAAVVGAAPPYNLTYASFVIPIIPFAFNITNMNAGNWLFTEEKYYFFEFAFNATDLVPDTLKCKFTDNAGLTVEFYYNVSTRTAGVLDHGEAFSLGLPANHTVSGGNYVVTIPVLPKHPLSDTFDVDVEAFLNFTDGLEVPYSVVANNFFNLYAIGGLTETKIVNEAGRRVGGDVFNLYAFGTAPTGSKAYAHMYFKDCYHIKLLVGLRIEPTADQTIPFYQFGVKFYETGVGWAEGWRVDIALDGIYTNFHEAKAIRWNTTMYSNGDKVTSDGEIANATMYSFYEVDDDGNGKRYTRVWIDLWFDSRDGGSTAGARASAYQYAMAYDAVGGGFFEELLVGGKWGPRAMNATQLVCFTPLINNASELAYPQDIELVKLWANVEKGYNVALQNVRAEIEDIDVKDMYVSGGQLHAINTPTFADTMVPAMTNPGIFSGLITAIGRLIAGIVVDISPSLVRVGSFVLGLLDAIFSWTGYRTLATDIFAYISTWIVYAFTLVEITAGLLVDALNSLVWAARFFVDYLLGIPRFVLGILQQVAVVRLISDVAGLFHAWWVGGTYTMDGNLYDFTTVLGFEFMGHAGGSAVFAMITFLYIVLMPVRCAATMSLAPIMEPVNLFLGFTTWSLRMFDYGTRLMSLIWTTLMGLARFILKR